jgi:hypothetical protein
MAQLARLTWSIGLLPLDKSGIWLWKSNASG